MSRQTKCLLTGAAGFIGSHLSDALLARGAAVVGIDNLNLGRRANLKQAFTSSRFTFYEADVNDLARCREIVVEEKQAAPFDMAWHMGGPRRKVNGWT